MITSFFGVFHLRIRCRNNKMKHDRKKEDWAILPNFSTYLRFMHNTAMHFYFLSVGEKNNSRYIADGHLMKWHEECWLKTILKLLHHFWEEKKKLKPFCWHFHKHIIGFPWNNIPMQGLSANSKLQHSWNHPLPCNFPSLWSSKTVLALNQHDFTKKGLGTILAATIVDWLRQFSA